VNENEVRAVLLDAVPELTAPPDRMAEVSRRVARRRLLKLMAGVMAATVSLVAVAGVAQRLSRFPAGRSTATNVNAGPSGWPGPTPSAEPSPSGRPWSSQPPSNRPSGGARPSRSPGGQPAGGLVGRDYCPPTLDLVGPLGVDVRPDEAASSRVAGVTVCRYHAPYFDLSVDLASRRAGPVAGDPVEFGAALEPIVNPPPSPWNPEGCRYPSPGRGPITVDIVYVVDVYAVPKAYPLARTTCANPWPADPKRKLEEAVDRLLGPPY
jgi:hypothetical protein